MVETLFERRATAQEHYKKGLQLKREGYLLEAEQEFRQSMDTDPSYFDPLLELLLEQEETGISEEIRCDQLLRRAEQKYKFGMALLKHKRPDKAVRHLQSACEIETDNVRYHCGLAEALAACSRVDEALASLRIATKVTGGSNPRQHRAKANFLLGKLHMKEGRIHRARRRLLMAYSQGEDGEETQALLKTLGVGKLRRAFMMSRLKRREYEMKQNNLDVSEQVYKRVSTEVEVE
ncbi:hypothetical protein CEE37_01370 [candidate division LCP-89 bacterium B3_LCP]|uniref:Tetratricopeptide repeat protein n=1 Tax=candidate division LCP-89 bacterium B3_LCP TaxID=2012998 RepID=A0A532V588_UNCL8|nr:MAG: hypothetical protein CEE37_01370 [candidate division LCP-89 bacterium B3_LCP]